MKKYESLFILNSNSKEDEINEIIKNIENFISANSAKFNTEIWGKKKLAYKVGKSLEGFYFLISFETNQNFISQLENKLKLNEKIIKHMIVLIKYKNNKNRKNINLPNKNNIKKSYKFNNLKNKNKMKNENNEIILEK